MGTGKTTIGRPLADALKRPFVDNDELLYRRTGRSARELAQTEGLDALHGQEVAALGDALDETEPSVVGAAAATILDAGVRDRLRAHLVVWLRADPVTLAARAGAKNDGHRPDVGDQSRERDPLYEQVADLIVDTDACTPEQAVARIVDVVTLAG